LLLNLIYSTITLAQDNSGFSIFWNSEVGCQTLVNDPNDPKRGFALEDIQDGQCVKVCEKTRLGYFIFTTGETPEYSVNWSVTGGTILGTNSSSYCDVLWGDAGTGQLTFDIDTGTTKIRKNICIEIIKTPSVLFGILPTPNLNVPMAACTGQEVFFSNLSTTNNGSSLLYYKWDFGDGTTSAAFEPSHTYNQNGEYQVKLTVTNECGCSATNIVPITVGRKGINILCPSVVCDKQTVNYTLPQIGLESCTTTNNWSIIGGTINSVNNGVANVTWDQCDDNGFGYITYDPTGCNVDCFEKTTLKIPVVQSQGTIKGNPQICFGGQERYKLPQWPSTEFNWEVVGLQGGNAEIFITDQRNEVVLKSITSGNLTLKCKYYNTLLKCGGTAIFNIQMLEPIDFVGPDEVCQNTPTNFQTTNQLPQNWTLYNSVGNVVTTQLNTANFSWNFPNQGVFKLSTSAATGCIGFSKDIIVNKAPTPVNINSITNTNIETCPNVPKRALCV
jgi:PKD repeat protein